MTGGRAPVGLLASAAALIAACSLAACGSSGSGRSTAAFCNTMTSQQKQILAQMHQTASLGAPNSGTRALAELGASVEGISALNTYFQKLSEVAPSPIEADAQIVAKAYSKELDDMSNATSDPLGALGSAFMNSMMSSYQLNQLNQFALKNCGHDV